MRTQTTTVLFVLALMFSIAASITVVVADFDHAAPGVEQATELTPALSTTACTTDAECDVYAFRAGWDTRPVLVPSSDGGEGYVCPMGGELYDTENPSLGAQGVVCRNVFMQV